MNGLVCTTFTLEQNSGFKLERNKDLTFIVIIIDIDWYEKNYRQVKSKSDDRDNFFAISPSPILNFISLIIYLFISVLVCLFTLKQASVVFVLIFIFYFFECFFLLFFSLLISWRIKFSLLRWNLGLMCFQNPMSSPVQNSIRKCYFNIICILICYLN